MSRRKAAAKRKILPDPLFHSELLAKFINTVMRGGKKSLAERIVYDALQAALQKLIAQSSKMAAKATDAGDEGSDEGGDEGSALTRLLPTVQGDIRDDEAARKAALLLFRKALGQVTPVVEVKSRRVGGSTYQVPVEIRTDRRIALAMRWVVEAAGKRNEKTMVIRLGNELLEAFENRGGAVRKKEDVHRMAKANQAYAHYRW